SLAHQSLANLSVLDWAWHREVLRRTRLREELSRIADRIDFSQFLRAAQAEQEISREFDARAFRFAEAVKNKLEQSWYIHKGTDRAIDRQQRLVEQGLAIYDDNKRM